MSWIQPTLQQNNPLGSTNLSLHVSVYFVINVIVYSYLFSVENHPCFNEAFNGGKLAQLYGIN